MVTTLNHQEQVLLLSPARLAEQFVSSHPQGFTSSRLSAQGS